MIDRDARNGLEDLIRSYLDEQLTAFELDDALDEFRKSSDDAVRFVADAVWYHYVDFDDHLVVLTKTEWNYFQRLLLLLESSSEVSTTRKWHWGFSQLVAFVLLCCCGVLTAKTGIGEHLLIFFMPMGLVSIILSFFRRPEEEVGPYTAITSPFASIDDLRIAYEEAGFQKSLFPRKLTARRIRSPLMNWFWLLYNYALWMMFAPVPLIQQCFPVTRTDVRVKVA